jgi:hypothetical protein
MAGATLTGHRVVHLGLVSNADMRGDGVLAAGALLLLLLLLLLRIEEVKGGVEVVVLVPIDEVVVGEEREILFDVEGLRKQVLLGGNSVQVGDVFGHVGPVSAVVARHECPWRGRCSGDDPECMELCSSSLWWWFAGRWCGCVKMSNWSSEVVRQGISKRERPSGWHPWRWGYSGRREQRVLCRCALERIEWYCEL